MIEFDAREVTALANDLAAAGPKVLSEVPKVVGRGALNVKRQLQEEASSSGTRVAGKVAASISYETTVTANGAEAEIGPESGHPRGHPRAGGGLAFYYLGNSKTGPSLPDPMGAAHAEAPRLEAALAALARDVL